MPELQWVWASPGAAPSAARNRLLLRDPAATPFLDANLIAGLQGIFRPRASLHIGSLRDGGGQELAQMPLVRRWTRVGPIPVRQLEAGPRNQASVTDLLVDPDSPDAALGFLHALRRQPGWDLLECRAVVAGGNLARAATTVGATVRPDVPAFAIPLDPATPMLSSGRNRELRRLNRRMAETAGVEIKVYGTEDGEWPGALDALMTYHRRRWTNTVTPSPFEDTQLRSRFAAWFATPPDGVRPLAAVLREIGSGWIRGVVLGFEGSDETHAWRIAYDPALRPYSPGIQLLTALARDAQVRGHGFLELGRGADAYKRTWHTIQRDRVTVRWHRNTPLYRAIDISRRYLGRGPYSRQDSR